MSDTNPLAGVNPASLDELFSRDPLDLSDQEIEVITTELRRMRTKWMEAEAQGKTRGPVKAKAKLLPAPPGLDLSDLEI